MSARWVLQSVALGAALLVSGTAPAAAVAGATPAADPVSAAERAGTLRGELALLRSETARVVQAYEEAEHTLGVTITSSVTLGERAEDARRVAGASEEQVAERVAALYRTGGRAGLLSSLTGARGAQDLAARLANVSAVVDADGAARDRAGAARDAVGRAEAQSAAASTEQTRLTRELREQSARLTALLARQEQLVTQADTEVQRLLEQQRQAARVQAARELAARLKAARTEAERQRAAQALQAARDAQRAALALRAPSPGPAPGPLPVPSLPAAPPVPVAVPTGDLAGAYAGPTATCPVGSSHSFTDTWHAPRSGGRQHQGTDLFAPEGSPAYAVVDGTIDKTGNGGLGGITLWLRGDNGDRYYYAHNSANVAQRGQRVRAGEVIAYVGRTGNARTTPAHVHFEAHPGGGAAANPYPWLAAICAA